MIVADTQLSVYLTVPVAESDLARAVFQRDPAWAAPILWRSEFRNAMLGYIRTGRASANDGIRAFDIAATHLRGREHDVPTVPILTNGATNRISAYDLEFVVLAQQLGVPLVTFDKQVLARFPGVAVHPRRFLDA